VADGNTVDLELDGVNNPHIFSVPNFLFKEN
jgi:hypothetical protein